MRLAYLLALALPLAACDSAADKSGAGAGGKAEAKAETTIAAGLGNDASTFAKAVKAAGLDTTLTGPGPYTVLVPVDGAFAKLPAGALDGLMTPETRPQLTKLLTNHVLSGAILSEDIAKAIEKEGGKTQLMTVGGAALTATRDGDAIVLTDPAGAKARVTAADSRHSNGIVHKIDTVLTPA
ncbi:fasciclin domain-containing protein [Sphingomonas mesophila]|uniref:fasciclin domain-containing protein n=1 Tax=Sphingomonas mesophila TaxID=2303576 RepID=UPI000E58DAB8|nr:fasciclin domain-containing protein [Sphingomonas mesophila]